MVTPDHGRRSGPGPRCGPGGGRPPSPAGGPSSAGSPWPWPGGPRFCPTAGPPRPGQSGDLLIALVRAGAAGISPPACAGCGKLVCALSSAAAKTGTARPADAAVEPCAACGKARPVSCRDRAGRPRCAKCPDGDGRDPVNVIHGIVAVLDPGAGRDTVADAVRRSAPRPSYQQKLAWALEENPALLTGDGHLAPLRAIPRFTEMLDGAGVAGVVRPACGRCGRVVRIDKPLDGVRVCRTCIARSRAEQCARCGAARDPVTSDGQGRPVCANCFVSDPDNLEACTGCGRRRRVNGAPRTGRSVPGALPLPVAGLLDLRPDGSVRDLPANRAAVVPGLPAPASRGAPPAAAARRSPRHAGQPALRRLHPAAVFGGLPRLQRSGSSLPRPVRPLHHQRPAGRADGA